MAIEISKNKYFYIASLIVGTVIISIILITGLIRPTINANADLTKEIKEKKENLNFLEEKLSILQNLKKEETRLLEEKEKVSVAFPEEKEVSRLFVQFEKMVSSTGANITSAINQASSQESPEAIKQGNTVNMNSHNYSVVGKTSTYESLKGIFSNSENALRLVGVDGINISRGETGYNFNINLKTYSRGEK